MKNKFNPNEYLTGVINIKDGKLIDIKNKFFDESDDENVVIIGFSPTEKFEARAVCYVEASNKTELEELRTNQINKIIRFATNVFADIDYDEFKEEAAISREDK